MAGGHTAEYISGSILGLFRYIVKQYFKPKQLEVAESMDVVKKKMKVSGCSACLKCLAATCSFGDS